MMFVRAFFGLLLVLCCVGPAVRARAGETHWNARDGVVRGPGTAEIRAPGVLSLASEGAEVTEVRREPEVPERYVFSFRARVSLFGSESGTAVYDGRHRALLTFTPLGLALRDATDRDVIVLPWDHDTRFHDYTLIVNAGRAVLLVDGLRLGTFSLPRDTGEDRVSHWVKGPERAALWVDHTNLEPDAGYTFEETWDTLDSVTVEGPGLVDTRHSELLLSTSEEGLTRALRFVEVDPEYIATFTQRVLTFGDELGFAVYDGQYRAELLFAAEGLSVRQADGSTVVLTTYEDDASRYAQHEYELITHRDVTMGKERGKARLLVDGVFAGEWNLERDLSPAHLEHWVRGPSMAAVAIDHTTLRAYRTPEFAFADNFESERVGTAPSYWMFTSPYDHTTKSGWAVANTRSSGHVLRSERQRDASLALLHVFAKTARFTGKFLVEESGDAAALWFNLRRNSEQARVTVRASLHTGRFELIEREADNRPRRVLATYQGPKLKRGFHSFAFAAWGPFCTFVLDGQAILSSTRVKHQNYGRIGFETKDARVLFDDVAYEGDAPVERGVLEGVRVPRGERKPLESASTGLLRRQSGSVWLTNTENTCFISEDQGATFRYEDPIGCGTNLFERPRTRALYRIVTDLAPSGIGHMLTVERSPTGLKCALDGPLDASCWDLGRRALPAAVPTGKLMPGKVTQTSTGRVFVAVPKPTAEGIGGMHVYYSDDLITFWPASTAHDMDTLGLNVEAGKVVEVGDGSVKLFMRSNVGALLESVSRDGGHTWSFPTRTVFRSPRADFNVERDPVSGFHYMVWQYDDPDETRPTNPDGTMGPIASRGRARLGLAVSRDGTKSWQFLLTVDDWEGHAFRHMNTSILAYDHMVWVATARRTYNGRDFSPDVHDLALFRVDTRQVFERALFPGTH